MEKYERKNRIAEALSLRGMRQVELVEKTGLSKASVNSWIYQRWQPKQKALYAMARALDVSEMWLAGYDVPKERPAEQVQMDNLAALVHRLRKNEKLKNVCMSISNLKDDQLSIVENVANELNKLNQQAGSE